MKTVLHFVYSIICLFCVFCAYAEPAERTNVSRVWEDVSADFFHYDAVYDKMTFNVLPQSRGFVSLSGADFHKLLRERLGVDMPDGSSADYKGGKFRVRSTKTDIEKIEKSLEIFRKLEGRFNTALSKGNKISGNFYNNLNGIALIFVDEHMLKVYQAQKKERKKNKKSRRRQNEAAEAPETLEELDEHRLVVLVFENGVKSKEIKKFKNTLKVSESICIYENNLDSLFMDMKGDAPIVLVDCYGFEVKTCRTISELLAMKKEFCFWFNAKGQHAARDYRPIFR